MSLDKINLLLREHELLKLLGHLCRREDVVLHLSDFILELELLDFLEVEVILGECFASHDTSLDFRQLMSMYVLCLLLNEEF